MVDYIGKFNQVYNETRSLDLAINTIITIKGIRDAFLFEPRNFDLKWSCKSKDCKKIKNAIIKDTTLKTETCDQQGIYFINEQKYDSIDFSKDSIGKILGFPCELNLDNDISYIYHINAIKDKEQENFFAVICPDESKESVFNDIRDNIQNWLHEINLNIQIIIIKKIKYSYVYMYNSVKNENYLHDKNLIESIKEFIEESFLILNDRIFHKENKNILLTIMSFLMNDPSDIFYPLNPEQIKHYKEYYKQISTSINNLIS